MRLGFTFFWCGLTIFPARHGDIGKPTARVKLGQRNHRTGFRDG